MSEDSLSTFERMAAFYENGSLPWDEQLPPPEVIDIVAKLEPGRALDLGCGYGRASIYLAQQGWQVEAVDFVPKAIAEARRRASAAGVADAITFHQSSVDELEFLRGRFQLALDVGCMHALSEEQQAKYYAELQRLLSPGATYLLFVRIGAEVADDSGPNGQGERHILDLFRDGFLLDRKEFGITTVEGQPAWRSAWFWFRRRSPSDKEVSEAT